MGEQKDFYVVVRNETDSDWFPPPPFFKMNQFTKTPGRIFFMELNMKLLLWEVSVDYFESDRQEVLNVVRKHAGDDFVYFSQPFSGQPNSRELNLSFFRQVATEFEKVKVLIRDPNDKACKGDLSILKQEFGKLAVLSFQGKLMALKSVFLIPCKQQSAANVEPPAAKPPEELKSAPVPAQEESKAAQSVVLPLSNPPSVPSLESRLKEQELKSAPVPAQGESKAAQSVVLPLSNPPSVPSLESWPEEQKNPFSTLPAASARKGSPHPHDSSLVLAEEDVRCVVCMSLFRDMLSAECCGSVVCRECAPRLFGRCPTCRKRSSFVSNKTLNRLLSGLPEKCVCGEEVSSKNMASHKRRCSNRMFVCPSCNLTLDRNGLKQHLRDIHREEILLRIDRNSEILSSD